jgi:hypothetical protein
MFYFVLPKIFSRTEKRNILPKRKPPQSINATANLSQKQVLICLYGTIPYGGIYLFKVAVTFSNQIPVLFYRGLHD